MLKRFIASPASGYILIALVVAAAGAGIWFWYELKEFGSLSEQAEQQALRIEQQQATINEQNAQIILRDEAIQSQTRRAQSLQRNARLQQLAVQEAVKNAKKALRECMSMHIADGMRFGPSRENRDDKARSNVDG